MVRLKTRGETRLENVVQPARRSAKIETRRVSGNLGRIRHQTGPPGVDHPKPSKPRLGTWGDERALDQVLEICPSPLSREQNVYVMSEGVVSVYPGLSRGV